MTIDGVSVWKNGNATVNISILWSNSEWNATILISNATRDPVAQLGWTPWLAGAIAVHITSFILNLMVLIFQSLPQVHISSFTIYLIVIFITNILHLSFVRPIGTLVTLSGKWTFGHGLCVIYMYFNRVVSVIPPFAHVLISVNRLWAIQYPILYRQYHNKKTAVFISLGMIGYVHLVPFPPFLVDLLYSRPPETLGGCPMVTGTMLGWNRADFVLDRLVPVVLVISVYIYIIIKRWQGKEGKVGMVKQVVILNAVSSTNARSTQVVSVVPQEKAQASPAVPPQATAARRKKVKPFIVLTMTSVSVVVCWVPADVYWFFLSFLNIRPSNTVFSVTSMLFSLQMVFDPLMWYFSLR